MMYEEPSTADNNPFATFVDSLGELDFRDSMGVYEDYVSEQVSRVSQLAVLVRDGEMTQKDIGWAVLNAIAGAPNADTGRVLFEKYLDSTTTDHARNLLKQAYLKVLERSYLFVEQNYLDDWDSIRMEELKSEIDRIKYSNV